MTTPAEDLLDVVLPFAVAMNILTLKHMPADERAEEIATWTQSAREPLLEHGDALLNRRPPYTAQVFNHLARALAALAFQPGGVDFGERHHFEVPA